MLNAFLTGASVKGLPIKDGWYLEASWQKNNQNEAASVIGTTQQDSSTPTTAMWVHRDNSGNACYVNVNTSDGSIASQYRINSGTPSSIADPAALGPNGSSTYVSVWDNPTSNNRFALYTLDTSGTFYQRNTSNWGYAISFYPFTLWHVPDSTNYKYQIYCGSHESGYSSGYEFVNTSKYHNSTGTKFGFRADTAGGAYSRHADIYHDGTYLYNAVMYNASASGAVYWYYRAMPDNVSSISQVGNRITLYQPNVYGYNFPRFTINPHYSSALFAANNIGYVAEKAGYVTSQTAGASSSTLNWCKKYAWTENFTYDAIQPTLGVAIDDNGYGIAVYPVTNSSGYRCFAVIGFNAADGSLNYAYAIDASASGFHLQGDRTGNRGNSSSDRFKGITRPSHNDDREYFYLTNAYFTGSGYRSYVMKLPISNGLQAGFQFTGGIVLKVTDLTVTTTDRATASPSYSSTTKTQYDRYYFNGSASSTSVSNGYSASTLIGA